MTIAMLTIAFFAVAVLYSSVGHAGASGYLAVMALLTQMPQEEMKALALALNILVGLIGAYRFREHFHLGTFWPLAITATPMAFLGGSWRLPTSVFKPLIGAVLILSAVWLVRRVLKPGDERPMREAPVWASLSVGAGLGLLAGLTGTGGGIFLSPVLLLMGWADPRRTASISVCFVLLNSMAGMAGVLVDGASPPAHTPLYLVAAGVGGLIGSGLGAKRLPGDGIRLLLAVVLCIAAVKMVVG